MNNLSTIGHAFARAMPNPVRLVLVSSAMTLGLLLSACGGGGGGGGSTPAPANPSNPSQSTGTVTSYAPSSGAEGSRVTFTGTGLSTAAGAYVVTIDGQVAEIVGQTSTSIVALVPRGARTGTLRVESNDWSVSSSDDFVVGKATIASVTPRQGAAASTVTITGDFFGAGVADNEVTINGVPLEVLTASRTSLTVRVPPTVGSGRIVVRSGSANATSPENFFVVPKITGFSPSTITQGETVTLRGSNLTRDALVRVGIDSVAASVVTAQGTEMTVTVPAPARTGSLYATNPEGVGDVSASQLTVISTTLPSIDRFVPAYGRPGTRITVYGKNFRATPAQNTVRIGGIAATVTAVSSNAEGPFMWVTVPANMTPGIGYQLTVTTPEGTSAPSRAGFDVAETPPPSVGVSLSTTAIDFGTVFTGSYNEQVVTVTNIGAVNVTMGNAAVTGANFRYLGTSCYGFNAQLERFDTLVPGASCTINVDFGPSSVGASYGALTFSAAGSVKTVALQGAGAAPLVPMPTFTPASLAFGNQELNTTSAPRSVRLRNTGTGPLVLDADAPLPIGGEYALTHTCPATLLPNQECDLLITFTPTRFVEPKAGSVVLVSNYTASRPTVLLSGTGTLARSGRLALVSRASWGIESGYVDGSWIGRLGNGQCGEPGVKTVTVAPGNHTVSANDPLYLIQPTTVAVGEGQCVTHVVTGSPTCLAPNFISGGFCYPPILPTCTAPAELRNGACVVPGVAASPGNGSSVGSGGSGGGGTVANSGTGGVAGEFQSNGSTGVGAAQCVQLGQKTDPARSWADTQTMTNTCSFVIYVMWCHSPSTRGGTRSTECGTEPRFYEQFRWLEPGETHDNFYSLPIDTTIWYGACSGGKYSRPAGGAVTETGRYTCR